MFKLFNYIDQDIADFHILIGPNASGKSTFLEGLEIVGKLTQLPLGAVIEQIAENDFLSLVHNRVGDCITLAFNFDIGTKNRDKLMGAKKKNWNRGRYDHPTAPDIARFELQIALDSKTNDVVISHESLLLGISAKAYPNVEIRQPELFPSPQPPPRQILFGGRGKKGWHKVLSRKQDTVYFVSETTNWNMPYKVGRSRLGLSSIPEDPERFPVATAIRDFFSSGLSRIQLSSSQLKKPSPPGAATEFKPDGSNLAHVINRFKQKTPKRFAWWMSQVKGLLEDIDSINIVERDFDKHLYLLVKYKSGVEVPSWSLSDGTLRIIALTLLAYLQDQKMYLIEEPENGLHPKALEGVYEVLSSSQNQVLMATHSPVLLKLTSPESLLIFAKTKEGEADIIPGSNHPHLRKLQGHIDLDLIFASGVLS